MTRRAWFSSVLALAATRDEPSSYAFTASVVRGGMSDRETGMVELWITWPRKDEGGAVLISGDQNVPLFRWLWEHRGRAITGALGEG